MKRWNVKEYKRRNGTRVAKHRRERRYFVVVDPNGKRSIRPFRVTKKIEDAFYADRAIVPAAAAQSGDILSTETEDGTVFFCWGSFVPWEFNEPLQIQGFTLAEAKCFVRKVRKEVE